MSRAIVVTALALALVAGSAADSAPRAGPFSADAQALRALRSANNRALAARNIAKTMELAAGDYALVGGNDGIHRSRDEVRDYWLRSFEDPHYLPCVRQPETVSVGEFRGVRRAAEIGSWRCPANTAGGEEAVFGKYLAHWSMRGGEWKVVSDNYVTLGCHGPGCR